jgi:hypothetical protein
MSRDLPVDADGGRRVPHEPRVGECVHPVEADAVFPTASGYNPTLTICAVALRTAHGMVRKRPA